jgi:hypothetical protein
MVSKCANRSCSAVFRYPHGGIIFHVTSKAAGADKTSISGTSTNERFWLCGDCSPKAALIPKDPGVLAVPRPYKKKKHPRRWDRSTFIGPVNDWLS